MDRQALAKAVAQFPGATFEAQRIGRSLDIRIMAPPSHHWSGGMHEMVTDGTYGPAEWQRETYREAIHRLKEQKAVPCAPEDCPSWVDGACEWWEEKP
jgi:hypothetical protein